MNYNKKGMEEHVHKEKEKKKEEQKEEKKNTKKDSNQYDIFFVIMTILNFFIVILTIIFLLIFLFLPNSFQGNNIDEYNNDFCQNKLNENYDLLCTNKYYKNNYKKSKFIWIFTDGTASDQLTILNNYEKYKISSKFLVKGDDITYKHTNELHQALLSGKHNRNILGKEINFDHVIKQLKNAGYKINYRGWSLPIPDIIGETNGKNENKFFYKQFIDDDHEITAFSSFCNLTNPFPFLELKYDKHQNQIPNEEINFINKELVEQINDIINENEIYLLNQESKENLYKQLDEFFEKNSINLFGINIDNCLKKSFEWNESENISIIYYTTELDHFNHLFGKSHIYTVLQMYITEKMIEKLMEWIDINDDYVLIVSTDHGGQEFFGEDALKNHGENIPGNEGIFFIYSKELKDNYEILNINRRYIHIVDENEIVSQILIDINIPINSRGFPVKLFNDDINEFISLKMKEIQLIQLCEKYIEKYKNKYESKLNNVLQELKNDFSQTQKIIKENLSEDLYIKADKIEIFKNFINEYKNKLISQQDKIIDIIDIKKRTTTNIVLFIVIFIFIASKFIFEFVYLFFILFDIKKEKINKIKFYMLLILFSFIYIFIYYYSILGDNHLRNNIIQYVTFYGFFISLLLIGIIISNNLINNIKVMILTYSILCFTIIILILAYSDSFYYLKKNLFYSKKIKRISFNIIYIIFMIPITFKEIYNQNKKKYLFYFCKKTIYAHILILPIFSIFIITMFIEDCLKKYYFEQNLASKIFVCFNFIIFIIFWIISNWVFYYEAKEDNNNGDLKVLKIMQNSNFSFFDINSKDKLKNRNLTDNENNNENKNLLIIKRIDGLPYIKVFLISCFLWMSDEAQKFFLLVIILPFYEVLNYLSNYFYAEINKVNLFKEQNKELNSNESPNVNNNININFYSLKFILYLIIQDMFIIGNHAAFALTKHSFGFEIDKVQQTKVIYVLKFLQAIFGNVSFYKFNFILVGFYLKKGIYEEWENNNNYSLNFIIRKILLNFRIDMDIIYIFYEMLINKNNEIFIELLIYSMVNISLFIFDYIGFGLTKLGTCFTQKKNKLKIIK